jgi:hypothetical protein
LRLIRPSTFFLSGLKAQQLLVLQRAHGSQRAELVMEDRHPHSGDVGQLLHVQRLRVIGSKPSNRSCRSFAEVTARSDSADAARLRCLPQALEYLQQEQNGMNVSWMEKITDEHYKLGK